MYGVYTSAMCNAWYLTSSWIYKLYHVHFLQDVQMATDILMNCLDTAVVNALVICCCKVEIHASANLHRILVILEEFAVNSIANGTLFNKQPGVCVEGICLKEIWPRNVRGTRHPREIAPGEKCRIPIQEHKSICVAVMTVPPWLTHIHTVRQTRKQAEIQTSFAMPGEKCR